MIDDSTLKSVLAPHLREEGALDKAFHDPTANQFDLGMDSISAFALLDDLQDHGVGLEFTELIADPSVGFLREASERAQS